MVEKIGARVLFAEPRDLDLWMVRLERRVAQDQRWIRKRTEDQNAIDEIGNPPDSHNVMLPLAVVRGSTVRPFVSDLRFKQKDELHVLINQDRSDEAEAWLRQMGWEP